MVGKTIDTEGLLASRSELARARKELGTLYAALDNVQSGLLILDGDLRAVYSNPALHRMFKSYSPAEIRERRPLYEELLRAAYSASAVELEDYVARRLAWVRSENAAATDLSMTNGTVLRCNLAPLPDGGRMLIYSDITDIVRHAQELQRMATTDGMTGIYNRRHFLTLAEREWERASRYQHPLSFLIFDIDYFKSINDAYGHEAGDEVITHLANVAAACKRGSDVLARIGGEEFALLLPETTLDEAQIVAERLRRDVAEHAAVVAAREMPTTVSVGVASRSPEMSGIAQLMSAADKALYEAKRGGRNRVVCFEASGKRVTAANPKDLVA